MHVDTVENLGRLAQREVAGRPRARPGEVAREEPFGGPRAEPAQRRDRGAHLVVVESAASACRSSVAARERDGVLRLPPREADREQLVLGRRAIRSRVGNAHASPTGVPKRSISRLRIATAENSDTCCAVIDVTSASNGSAWSGGRKPASFTVSSAITG